MSSRIKTPLVRDALQTVIWRRRSKAGLIHPSDRGSQYVSKGFRRLLEAHGIEGNMRHKGDYWNNPVIESFLGTLKQQRVQSRNYPSRYEAQQDILDYILMFYNRSFTHVFLAGMEEQLLPHRTSIEEDSIEQERRLAYVGITRARKTLAFTLADHRRRGGEHISCEPSRFLNESPEKYLAWERGEAQVDPPT